MGQGIENYGQDATTDIHDGYFVVSQLKLALMSLATLGLYERYWMYKNWKYIKKRDRSNIMPFWRSAFAMLWIFQLSKKIQDHSEAMAVEPDFEAKSIFGLYCAFFAVSKVDILTFVGLLSFLPLFALQSTAVKLNKTLEVSKHKHYSFGVWNYIILSLGALFWALIILALLFPE